MVDGGMIFFNYLNSENARFLFPSALNPKIFLGLVIVSAFTALFMTGIFLFYYWIRFNRIRLGSLFDNKRMYIFLCIIVFILTLLIYLNNLWAQIIILILIFLSVVSALVTTSNSDVKFQRNFIKLLLITTFTLGLTFIPMLINNFFRNFTLLNNTLFFVIVIFLILIYIFYPQKKQRLESNNSLFLSQEDIIPQNDRFSFFNLAFWVLLPPLILFLVSLSPAISSFSRFAANKIGVGSYQVQVSFPSKSDSKTITKKIYVILNNGKELFYRESGEAKGVIHSLSLNTTGLNICLPAQCESAKIQEKLNHIEVTHKPVASKVLQNKTHKTR